MTPPRVPRTLFVGVALLTVLLTGCAPDAPSDASSPTPSATTPSASAAPSSAAPSAPAAADVTCDTLIKTDVREAFDSSGWTYQEGPFSLGDMTLDDGLWCQWGDFAVANDHVQIYGWAPISKTKSDKAMSDLVATGWVREDSPAGAYITEDPSMAVSVDADGYGMTFLFGDGWVTVSDTKQGLLLIQRPAV